MAVDSHCLSLLHLLKDVLDTSWRKACKFIESLSFERTIHGEGLAAASLPICKDAYIFAINCGLDKLVDLTEEGSLSGIYIEYFLKVVIPLRLVIVGSEVFFFLSQFDIVDADIVIHFLRLRWAWSQTAINSDISFVLLEGVVGSSEAFGNHLHLNVCFFARVTKLMQSMRILQIHYLGSLVFGVNLSDFLFLLGLQISEKLLIVDTDCF